ncbi:hypothetical protein BDQ17DRAFT_300281 [Cyathus striatus]|nr:hypothetical protein BDQ17DRAFT_300281 [Cyathus striatus]
MCCAWEICCLCSTTISRRRVPPPSLRRIPCCQSSPLLLPLHISKMGKWTYNYTEQILHAKISSLVTGAINRAAVEKDPSITFDDFVNTLDTGDSFTGSLIDILVKELAERATRPENDRRLIADRTAKSLRLLATPLRIYREPPSTRNISSRRSSNFSSDYLNIPPNEMELEEDNDEFGTSAVYDAPGASWAVAPRILSSSPSPPLPEPPGSATRIPASSSRSGPWSMDPSEAGAAMNTSVRHPGIRRPVRTRNVDFNEFTHRRRSAIRDTHNAAESVTEPRENNWVRTAQPTRRFFPFTRTRRHESINNTGWDYVEAQSLNTTESTPLLPSDGESSDVVRAHALSLPSTSTASQTNEDRSGPRLRRGGLRAPESMLSRRAHFLSYA